MNVQDVVEVVKEERRRKGWTQYRLAKESGISREMIAKLELGAHMPRIDTLLKLCRALSLDVMIRRKGKS